VTTFAGTSNVAGGVDGTPGTFNSPYGLAVDAARNVVVADTINNTVRRITPGRVVSTVAGTLGQPGFLDATGAAATPTGKLNRAAAPVASRNPG